MSPANSNSYMSSESVSVDYFHYWSSLPAWYTIHGILGWMPDIEFYLWLLDNFVFL